MSSPFQTRQHRERARRGGVLVFDIRGADWQRMRADLVAGHQGQRQQQFVFGELVQVECSRAGEHIFLGVGIERRSLIFPGNKVKPMLELQRRVNRPQATLTGELQLRIEPELQPGVRLTPGNATALGTGLPLHDVGRHGPLVGMAGFGQAVHASKWPLPCELLPIVGKTFDIQAARIMFMRFHGLSVRRSKATIDT